jgi:Ca2+-binding EF-hand superfamily protein
MATMAMAKKYKKMERETKLAKALEAKHEEIEKWFKEYDKDASGDIDRDELGKLMTAVKRDATQDAETAPVEDNILDLIMKKYADASGRIKQDRILNAIKAFKSYLAQELTYKDLFAKCTWSTP